MLSKTFLGVALLGAEWVLYLLLLISVLSVALIIERFRYYRAANTGLADFRGKLRSAVEGGDWKAATRTARARTASGTDDFESSLADAILSHHEGAPATESAEIYAEIAQDAILRTRVHWERNLSILATIGNNAPFVGLFGTVIGIIQAFNDLSAKAGTGVQTVTAGLADALIATGFGILVAVPAVVAFNMYQRRVRAALTEAEALKSFLVGKLASGANGGGKR